VINMPGKRKLYTSGDIAEKLGVTRQRALQIVNDRRMDFPEPYDTLPGNVQVWLITEVDRWVAANRPAIDEGPEGE
jgi:predicted DNA-binding transcriptional regulator AlpA